MSHVTWCHMSHVTHYMLHITCHMSHGCWTVKCSPNKLLKTQICIGVQRKRGIQGPFVSKKVIEVSQDLSQALYIIFLVECPTSCVGDNWVHKENDNLWLAYCLHHIYALSVWLQPSHLALDHLAALMELHTKGKENKDQYSRAACLPACPPAHPLARLPSLTGKH